MDYQDSKMAVFYPSNEKAGAIFLYSNFISKVKQGGDERTTRTVLLHGYNQRLGYRLLIA
jgi:hypothetical protein